MKLTGGQNCWYCFIKKSLGPEIQFDRQFLQFYILHIYNTIFISFLIFGLFGRGGCIALKYQYIDTSIDIDQY